MTPKKAPRLPTGVLICTLGALVLGTCSGMGATSQAITLLDPSAAVARPSQETLSNEEVAVERALTELQVARERAGRPFRSLRLFTVLGLSLSTMFCLVTALRLLFPAGLQRWPLIRVLSGAAILSAVLRTLDGAFEFALRSQLADPMRRLAEAQAAAMAATTAERPPGTEDLLQQAAELVPRLGLWMAGLSTFVVAGGFLAIGQFLRRDKVRAQFAPPSGGSRSAS